MVNMKRCGLGLVKRYEAPLSVDWDMIVTIVQNGSWRSYMPINPSNGVVSGRRKILRIEWLIHDRDGIEEEDELMVDYGGATRPEQCQYTYEVLEMNGSPGGRETARLRSWQALARIGFCRRFNV